MQISGNGGRVKRKANKVTSDIGASGKKVELGEKAEHGQDPISKLPSRNQI